MVCKNFRGRSDSNFGLNQLLSAVGMLCRIITGKFQLLKQGFRFIGSIAQTLMRCQSGYNKIKISTNQ